MNREQLKQLSDSELARELHRLKEEFEDMANDLYAVMNESSERLGSQKEKTK